MSLVCITPATADPEYCKWPAIPFTQTVSNPIISWENNFQKRHYNLFESSQGTQDLKAIFLGWLTARKCSTVSNLTIIWSLSLVSYLLETIELMQIFVIVIFFCKFFVYICIKQQQTVNCFDGRAVQYSLPSYVRDARHVTLWTLVSVSCLWICYPVITEWSFCLVFVCLENWNWWKCCQKWRGWDNWGWPQRFS